MSFRHLLRLIGVLACSALVATACLGGDAESTPEDPADVLAFDDADNVPAPAGDTPSTETGDDAGIDGGQDPAGAAGGNDTDDTAPTVGDGIPCEGGAFPGDDEFRAALCAAQFGQIDVLREGGEVDESWGPRIADAILAYADDREAALAELTAIAEETAAAAAGADAPAAAVEIPEISDDLRECTVEVGFLIVDAQLSGFDPRDVEEWQDLVDDVDDLVDAGDLVGAQTLICQLRDEIAAAL